MVLPSKKPLQAILSVLLSSTIFSNFAYAEKLPFNDYINTLKKEAITKGIDSDIVNNAFHNVKFLKRSVTSDKQQPQFKLSLDDYLSKAVPEWKVKRARNAYRDNYTLLNEIGKKYNVQPRFIVSLWGIESNFGRITGRHDVISSLSTMAYEGRREALFKKQLFAALSILEAGYIEQENFLGSWAGAMGQVQFMPTSYLHYAVDHDGDGKKDIWSNLGDVFASAANYLKMEGWEGSETWGRQVKLPTNFDQTLFGLKTEKSLQQWQQLGVRRFEGGALPKVSLQASVIKPDENGDRVYLIYNNYKVLMHWNRSYYFASAVSYLAERINNPRISAPITSNK
ncbi:lytic murein transglycosylase [Psychromonas sp. CNPT3]|uniref:lytic murein transglycosylase n=1 Tax=Psychromonas sp. CNPT3 TaxID=314282 RepID=UPI00006E34B0|nr:lytic murein transglycosylase [Psychromonas sp. CNPT3]AGH80744.1 lytic murein transglycosylase [Psychromonas sp. CNPT3]